MIALSGVRSSCDMLARNSDLCLFAVSSSRLLSWISRNSRTLSIAMPAWSANVLTSHVSLSENGRILHAPERDRAYCMIFAHQGHREYRMVADARLHLACAG
jgi:hypothetical protein